MVLNGCNINYYDKGTGETIVFLHGWGSRFAVFSSYLDHLADFYRVCALDLPGFGDSDEPPEAWSVDNYADVTVAFLSGLGVKKAILIGHSFGGRIVIKLANRGNLPFIIDKLILVDSAGIRPRLTGRQKVRQTIYKFIKSMLSMPFINQTRPQWLEVWRRRNGSPDYNNATPRMRECFVKVVNEDLTHLLSTISYSTLLIWGENDLDTPLSDAKTMESMIPDAGLVTLKHAGHYSFLDQPFIFRKVLDSYLNIEE